MIERRHLPLALVLATVVSLVTGVARATVTQVDGTILPQTGALQTFLDAEGEGGAPAATALNAITDASTVPEIFLPNLATVVTFKDIAEGAGFENSFGYYNVGDDLTDRRNLHPVLGCSVPRARLGLPGLLAKADCQA